jgi:hypothetical protein
MIETLKFALLCLAFLSLSPKLFSDLVSENSETLTQLVNALKKKKSTRLHRFTSCNKATAKQR